MDDTARIVAFLRSIGMSVREVALDGSTFLPGIAIENGELLYDPAHLPYPGDLLHEAGHLAFTPAAERPALTRESTWGQGEENAAIAWSYAAALHIGLDPAVVFHSGGYRGSSPAFLENFAAGRFVGVPLLQWAGMAEEKTWRRTPDVAYPTMLRWLRE